MQHRCTVLSSTLAVAALVAVPALARAPETQDARTLRDAEEVVTAAVTAPDQAIPRDLLEKAECVGVFPGITKGAFIVGGEFGRGVLTCREPDGKKMGPPAFFSMGGASLGWQFGGKSADVVLLVMNEDGVKRLLQDRFTLGVEAAAAIGPVGRTAEAATDAQLHAEVLSWSRSRGVFAGFSLEGAVIQPSDDANEAFYGRPVTAREILVAHEVHEPRAARPFTSAVTEYARRGAV
jgi:lipid-binding SYLF domain-containing protein